MNTSVTPTNARVREWAKPGIHTVLAAAAEHAPDAVPPGYRPPRRGRIERWLTDKLSGSAAP